MAIQYKNAGDFEGLIDGYVSDLGYRLTSKKKAELIRRAMKAHAHRGRTPAVISALLEQILMFNAEFLFTLQHSVRRKMSAHRRDIAGIRVPENFKRAAVGGAGHCPHPGTETWCLAMTVISRIDQLRAFRNEWTGAKIIKLVKQSKDAVLANWSVGLGKSTSIDDVNRGDDHQGRIRSGDRTLPYAANH